MLGSIRGTILLDFEVRDERPLVPTAAPCAIENRSRPAAPGGTWRDEGAVVCAKQYGRLGKCWH